MAEPTYVHGNEVDALAERAEALPPGPLPTALEELACLLDDAPGPGAPDHIHEQYAAMVAEQREYVAALEREASHG